MYLHVFLFNWTSAAGDADKARALADILAFQCQIPGLLETYAGENESPRSRGNSFGGVMKFVSHEAFEAYVTHPQHEALIAWLMPMIEPTELDLRA